MKGALATRGKWWTTGLSRAGTTKPTKPTELWPARTYRPSRAPGVGDQDTCEKARADRDARGCCGAVRPNSFAGPGLAARGCPGQSWKARPTLEMNGRARSTMLAKAPQGFKACSGTKVLVEAPETPWYSLFRLVPRAAPGPQVKARRTRAARFPPTSSGASGAKPHPVASCPSRPTAPSKLGPKPPKQGGMGHTSSSEGAREARGTWRTAILSRAGTTMPTKPTEL